MLEMPGRGVLSSPVKNYQGGLASWSNESHNMITYRIEDEGRVGGPLT
jgi:hypothetical protein